MRIRDWISDVCSSDLVQVVVVVDSDRDIQAARDVAAVVGDGGVPDHAVGQRNVDAVALHQAAPEQADLGHGAFGAAAQGHVFAAAQGGRKSVVEGKRVADSVYIGGWGIVNKKT